jgi:hypothetical protein
MVISQMETEIAELDSRKAAAEAELAQSHQRTRALERESTGALGASGSSSLSAPRERRSPRRSPSAPTEIAALLHLFQMQQQQAADQRREDDHCSEEQRREDRHEAVERAQGGAAAQPQDDAGCYALPRTVARAHISG